VSQPQPLGDGTLNGDRRQEKRRRRNADTNAPADADVSVRSARALSGELDREERAREALRQLAAQAEITVKPTRAQRKADAVAAATATGTVASTPAKLPASLKPGKAPKTKKQKTAKDRWKARKKFVHRIPKKMKVTRTVAWVGVTGIASVTGTVRTAAKAARAAKRAHGRRANEKPAKSRKQRTAGHRRPFGSKYSCCDKTYSSAEALNAHWLAEHEGETPMAVADGEQALLAPGTTKATAGTVRVLPPVHGRRGRRRTPAGRHRPGHNRRRFNADDYVRAHREEITRIGDRMSSGEARNVQQALLAWGELKPRADRPWTLDELRGVLVGLERAFVVGAEALDTMERTLNRPGGEQRGCNIDMSVTRPGMRRAREGMAETARGLTQVIADFETTYWPYLRGLLAAPAVAPNRR
jgi:hypothetical protein